MAGIHEDFRRNGARAHAGGNNSTSFGQGWHRHGEGEKRRLSFRHLVDFARLREAGKLADAIKSLGGTAMGRMRWVELKATRFLAVRRVLETNQRPSTSDAGAGNAGSQALVIRRLEGTE